MQSPFQNLSRFDEPTSLAVTMTESHTRCASRGKLSIAMLSHFLMCRMAQWFWPLPGMNEAFSLHSQPRYIEPIQSSSLGSL